MGIAESKQGVLPGHELAATEEGVFGPEQAATLAEADATHWWFRSKAAFVRHLAPSSARRPSGRYLDLGGGPGGVTKRLDGALGSAVLVDGSQQLASIARRRHDLTAVVASTHETPFPDATADVITLLDIIEHQPDPMPTLRETFRLLRPGGVVLVAVPAHPRLWSKADELLRHVRRYTKPMLRTQLAEAGFEGVRVTHVFSWLFLPVWLKRRGSTSAEGQLGLDERSAIIDAAARVLTVLEAPIARLVSLPFGTTIIGVARRPPRVET